MSVPTKRFIGFLVLFLIAVMICAKGFDTSESQSEMILPYLAALFLVYMHFPVRWKNELKPIELYHWFGPALLLITGGLFDILLLQACGWVWAWHLWTAASVDSAALRPTRASIAFLFIFPWITYDFQAVGWWYRLSGAWVTSFTFEILGYPVTRQGTEMVVGGIPLSVEAGCAGMGLLQSLLVVGTILLLMAYPRSRLFYLLLPTLPLIAWLANTMRIVTISLAGVCISVSFAEGLFHTFGGLLVILIMVLLCIPLLLLIRKYFPDPSNS